MNRKCKVLILGAAATLLSASSVKSQIVDFYYIQQSKCAPSTVDFDRGHYELPGFTAINWNWGDGTPPYTDMYNERPSHVYANAGKYVVTLTISWGLTTSTKQDTVYVYDKPLVSFAANGGVFCVASTAEVAFANKTSFVNDNTYVWDFGDGGASTLQNPTHTYSAGVYDVTLTATSLYGCGTDSLTINNSVKVINSARPIADFTDNGHTMAILTSNGYIFPCIGNGISIQFQSLSQGDDLKHEWIFGDAFTIFNETDPTHTYKKVGIYTVTLTVEDSVGCKDTMQKIDHVFIDGPSGTFEYEPLSGCIPFGVTFTPVIDKDRYGNFSADTVIWLPDGNTPIIRTKTGVNFPLTMGQPPNGFIFDTEGAFVPILYMIKWVDVNGTKELCIVLERGIDTIYAIDLRPNFITDSLHGLDVLAEMFNTTYIKPAYLTADSVHWDYGNGDSQWIYNPAKNAKDGQTVYNNEGSYTVKLTEYYKLCNKSTSYNIRVKDGVGIVETQLIASLHCNFPC
jgi:PKD repeat protein